MKIIHAVDNKSWCWTTTVENFTYCLPEHDHAILTQQEFIRTLENPEMEFNADLIFIRGYSNMFLNESTMERLKVPFISCLATGGVNLKMRLDAMKTTARKARAILVQNRQAEHMAYRAGYGNVVLIPNGVDCNLFHPEKKDPGKVVGIAANVKNSRAGLKGKDYILEACHLAGFDYKEVNAELPLSHESIAEWYRTLKYYIQPSEAEGCSNSVMEAMATGLPCFICENVGYHGEVCRDGIRHDKGQVVFVSRDPEEIAGNIRILEENPYLLGRIRHNARKFAEAHNWKHIAPRFNKMFKSALKQKTFNRVIDLPPEAPDPMKDNVIIDLGHRTIIPLRSLTINGKAFIAGNRTECTPEEYEIIKNREKNYDKNRK